MKSWSPRWDIHQLSPVVHIGAVHTNVVVVVRFVSNIDTSPVAPLTVDTVSAPASLWFFSIPEVSSHIFLSFLTFSSGSSYSRLDQCSLVTVFSSYSQYVLLWMTSSCCLTYTVVHFRFPCLCDPKHRFISTLYVDLRQSAGWEQSPCDTHTEHTQCRLWHVWI